MKKRLLTSVLLVGTVAISLAVSQAAYADLITVDENGNGTYTNANGVTVALSFAIAADPGPGGLGAVLTYNLPFATTVGDVGMNDAALGSPFNLDYVRFNGTTLVFYSDNVDGADALADTPSPPGAFYANLIGIPELGTEANNGAFYTPVAGQPGFVPGIALTYDLISDGTGAPVPGPIVGAGLPGLLAGFGALFGWYRKRKAARIAA